MTKKSPAQSGECICARRIGPKTTPFDIVCPPRHPCPWREETAPKTLPEVWFEFAAKCRLFLDKAERGAGRRYKLGPDPVWESLSGLADRTNRCLASDVRARAGAAWCLLREYRQVLIGAPLTHFWHVTILDNDWVTSDELTVIQLAEMFEKIRPFLESLTGNYVAVAELQPFTNVKHDDGGKLLSLHVHVIVWGLAPFDDEAAVAEWSPRFSGIWPEVPPIVIDPLGAGEVALARLVRYPLKGPCKCKTRYFNAETGHANLHESDKNDRYIRYHRLFEILSHINLGWLFDAAGDGLPLIEAVGHEMRAWAAAMQGPVPMTVEDIAAYWAAHRGSRSGQDRFRPPTIII